MGNRLGSARQLTVANIDRRIAVSSRVSEGSTFTVMLTLHLRARRRMTQHETNAGEGDLERVQSLVPGLDTVLCGGYRSSIGSGRSNPRRATVCG
jgi:hypothetical protein